MNWDPLMIDKAKAEGWKLVTTIDNGATHPYLMVTRHGGPFPSDLAAGAFVVSQAREGSALHRHALQLVAASRIRTAKGKK